MATKQTHICKYCGAETSQDDKECHAKPNKQTAVEWLVEQLINVNRKNYINNRILPISKNSIQHKDINQLIKQAKQMEKEQIMDAYSEGFDAGYLLANGEDTKFDGREQYYNEAYGNN